MKSLPLPARLLSASTWIPTGARPVDVGTDHGYLPVYLIQEKKAARVIATDLRKGPLARAKATADRYDVAEQVDLRLCDGLEGVGPDEVDTIILAGMGGETIAGILSRASWTADGKHRLILQPMSTLPELRQFLYTSGYRVIDEQLVREGDRIYLLLLAEGGEDQPFLPAEAYAGQALIRNSDPLLGEYLAELSERISKRIEGLKQSERQSDSTRLEEAIRIQQGLCEMEERWKSCQL